jgi:prophage regulatory protein
MERKMQRIELEKRERIIRKTEILNMLGLSDSTVWRMERAGKFPKRIRIGKSCGWFESEILAYLADLGAARG